MNSIMFKKLVLIAILVIFNVANLLAHALWLQTASTGKAGQKQSVKIIYSEPNEKPEKLADWYSDVKDFELWLITPDNKKTKLATVAGEDHFTAEFTPDKDGVYTLSVGHTAKDLGGKTVYQFNASALVKVGKSVTGNDPSLNTNELSVFADQAKVFKVNKPLSLKALYKNAANEKMYVTVSSPSGWSKSIETDETGRAEFIPIWPGTYYIEASKSWKEAGKLHGKDYASFWRAATLLVEVAK
jgi:uncharacterized GH25 family protein